MSFATSFMPKLSDTLLKSARQLYYWVFPALIEQDAKTEAILRQIYPTINWEKVRFYKGLPWFITGSFVGAIVLPATWGRRGIHVYFRDYRPDSFSNLMTVIHEGFHVLQYRDMGVGVGFFRRFMIYYLSDYLQLFFRNRKNNTLETASQIAYNKHPMEIPAYACEAAFQKYTIAQKGLIYTSNIPPELIRNNCGYTPQIAFPYLLIGGLITLIFMLLKPFIELCFLFIATPIYLFGKLLKIIRL